MICGGYWRRAATMDELERDLRKTLGNLADGARSSDELIDTTIARSAQIRRRRRTFAASAIAAVALVVAIAVASIAGAGTRGTPVRVADPGGGSSTSELTSTTTTTTVSPTTTTTPAPIVAPRPGSGAHHPKPGVGGGPVTTTTTAPCDPTRPSTDAGARAGEQYTSLPDGDIEVSFGGHAFGPARETYYYVLDDGSTHVAGFVQTYAPDQFGTHWFDLSAVGGGVMYCLGRVTFTVGIDVGSTTSTTDATIGNDTTTTAPETTTSTPK
jgi:hypothetical protein